MENKNFFHKIKKTLLDHKKTSYSDKTNNINFKIYKFCGVIVLLFLLVPTFSVSAKTNYNNDIPFDLIKDKYYFLIQISSTRNPQLIVSDTQIYFNRGDDLTYSSSLGMEYDSSCLYPSTNSDYIKQDNIKYYEYYNNSWKENVCFMYFNANTFKSNYVDTKLYLSNLDTMTSDGVVAPKNDEEIQYPTDKEPDESGPNNNDYVIIDGIQVPYNYAMLHYLIRIEFILGLLLTVTVVFFIINKLWSWCRRLFTTTF